MAKRADYSIGDLYNAFGGYDRRMLAVKCSLQAAVHAMGETPRREAHRDFIIFPLPPKP